MKAVVSRRLRVRLPQSSSESGLKKKLKKKMKRDAAWLRPSRKRKRSIKAQGDAHGQEILMMESPERHEIERIPDSSSPYRP